MGSEGVTYKLTWLPSVLRAAGLKVVEQPGWQTRGHGDMGTVKGVLCHHTAGSRKGNAPSLNVVVDGRPDLAGPLSQLVLGRDGTYYVVSAGRCYHAGAGRWRGITAGNSELIGIEAENTGSPDDNPWPAVQMDAYVRGVAAILGHIGAASIMCAGHLEYALPVGRKPDPSFSVGSREDRIVAMAEFRSRVASVMNNKAGPMEPASIRYKNPGAMWGSNAIAKKWGSTQTIVLNDGKGQGNNIAVFPDYVSGICAQLDLWRTSKNYRNKRFADAIATWSGHNEVESYIRFVLQRCSGMTRDTVMNDAFWRGPMAIPFLKAQAWHEAGKQYPASDADWVEAQRRVLAGTGNPVGGAPPAPPPTPEAPKAPTSLPVPTKVPTTKQDAKEVGWISGSIAAITGGLYGLWGNWAFRAALFLLIAAAVFWFVVRPVLRRLWALDEIEAGFLTRLRLALKGMKTALFSWLLGIAGVALPILSYVNDVDLSGFLPPIFGVPASMYQYALLAGIGWVVNKLRQVTNTPAGQTDLALAPTVESPPLVPDVAKPAEIKEQFAVAQGMESKPSRAKKKTKRKAKPKKRAKVRA